VIFLAGWGAVVLMIHQEWGDEVRLLPTFVAIAAIALHGTWVVDDAGIVWAYARNVAAGNGLVAYAGGPIGEGFSDPLWFLLLAAAERFGLRADIAAKTLGLIFGVLAVVLSARLVREQDGPVPVMVAMALATSASWALWAASGLETALCGLLMVVTTLRARAGGVWSSAVAAMLVTWTRPEGFLLAAAALGAGRAPGRTYGAPVMAFLGLLGIRVASLGLWWPLPAFVKLGLTTSALVGGWHYLLPSLVPVGALLLLASGTTAPEDRRRLLLDLLPLWAVLGFALISGGDWMRHGRYLAPALPYVYATCVPVLWRGLRNASPTPRTLRSALLMGIVLLPQAAESLGTRGAPPLPMVVQARQGEVLARAALSACGVDQMLRSLTSRDSPSQRWSVGCPVPTGHSVFAMSPCMRSICTDSGPSARDSRMSPFVMRATRGCVGGVSSIAHRPCGFTVAATSVWWERSLPMWRLGVRTGPVRQSRRHARR
jgi:hypothetical protein